MNKQRFLQLILLLCAAAFLVAGVLRKEHQAVFSQATIICTECVGLQPGYEVAPAPTPSLQPIFRLPMGVTP